MLHINDLTYRFGERLLIDNATVALPTGARVGLVGRNGAGKTTLFRLIARRISPESGSISVPRQARARPRRAGSAGRRADADRFRARRRRRARARCWPRPRPPPIRCASPKSRRGSSTSTPMRPRRAPRSILTGLGFDEAAQNRALSEFSGGWRMRVALAAVLFSAPDLLLLDEPTNYLDLEGALWLVDYLKTYPATIIVISHDRDLLDDVADHILHLERAKLTLWTGGYSSFERQRREQQILQGKAAKKQEEQRKHLQSFVDRFRASATKATQAQSRLKMLAQDGADRRRSSTRTCCRSAGRRSRKRSARRSSRWRGSASAMASAPCCRGSTSRFRTTTGSACSARTATASRPSPS